MLNETDFLSQVPAGHSFTIGELRVAFNLLAPQPNWKMLINAQMRAAEGSAELTRQVALCYECVDFMAGGGAVVTISADNRTLGVRAPGYYARIGA